MIANVEQIESRERDSERQERANLEPSRSTIGPRDNSILLEGSRAVIRIVIEISLSKDS